AGQCRPRHHPPLPLAPPLRLRRRPDRQRLDPQAGRGEPGPPRHPLPGRAARVQARGAGGLAPAELMTAVISESSIATVVGQRDGPTGRAEVTMQDTAPAGDEYPCIAPTTAYPEAALWPNR